MECEIHESLAALLTYPDDGYLRRVGDALATAANQPSEIGHELAAFAEPIGHMEGHAIQELFIQTFDLNPLCSLEMGWHLFGENYDRGLLLVKMRQQMRCHGLGETTELPDHLTHGLRLLLRLEHDAGAYFAEAIVLPALAKMLLAIGGKNNPYEHVLQAARLAVRETFPELPAQTAMPGDAPGLRVLA